MVKTNTVSHSILFVKKGKMFSSVLVLLYFSFLRYSVLSHTVVSTTASNNEKIVHVNKKMIYFEKCFWFRKKEQPGGLCRYMKLIYLRLKSSLSTCRKLRIRPPTTLYKMIITVNAWRSVCIEAELATGSTRSEINVSC